MLREPQFTTKNLGADGRPRYDFVNFDFLVDKSDSAKVIGTKRRRNQGVGSPEQDSDDDEEVVLVTQQPELICIIMIEYAEQRRPPEYYAIVQYLKKDTKGRSARSPFETLTWELQNSNQFTINIVAIKTSKLADIIIPYLDSPTSIYSSDSITIRHILVHS